MWKGIARLLKLLWARVINIKVRLTGLYRKMRYRSIDDHNITVLEVLVRARANVKKGWCQESSAKDTYGFSVAYWQPEACFWCIMGAIWKACGSIDAIHGEKAEAVIRDILDEKYISQWNDKPGRTKQEVLDLFDKAISIEQAKYVAKLN